MRHFKNILLLLFVIGPVLGRNIFISKEKASEFLSRAKRANSFFEEIYEGNAERECMEETCSYEEVREVFENDAQSIAYWRRLVDMCHSDMYSCNTAGTYFCKSGYYSHICLCKTGFVGKRCETKVQVDTITVCNRNNNLCENGGTCVDDEEDFYYCICRPGWFGIDCSRDINECEDFPCVHGNCTNAIGSYSCSCDDGYRGLNCDVEQQ